MKHRNRNNQRGGSRRHNNRPHRDGNREGQRDNQQNQQRQNGGKGGVHDNARHNHRPVIQSILPSPEILQEYEYASEGTVVRLLEMAETEQDRRNEWEDDYLRFHKKSLRLGQLFGFLLLLSVIWGVVYLGGIGQVELAKFLVIGGFGSVAAAALFSEIGRRLSRRPRMDRR
jgi:uncharacterized membrane protein